MGKKVIIGFCVLLMLVVSGLGIINQYSLWSISLAQTDFSNADLDEALDSVEWAIPYEVNVFDCSNMSGLLAKILQEKGYCVRIVSNMKHCWLLVKTEEGVQQVSATQLGRANEDGAPTLVMPLKLVTSPNLAWLVGLASEYSFSDNQYAVKPLGEEQTLETLDWGDSTHGFWNWITEIGNDSKWK
jgi:hypothetical protein